MITGTDVLLCEGDELVDVVRRGQGVLNVLPLAGVKEELDEGDRGPPTLGWRRPTRLRWPPPFPDA